MIFAVDLMLPAADAAAHKIWPADFAFFNSGCSSCAIHGSSNDLRACSTDSRMSAIQMPLASAPTTLRIVERDISSMADDLATHTYRNPIL